MSAVVLSKVYSEPSLNRREVLRFAGCKAPDAETEALLDECLREISGKLTFRVCYCELGLRVCEDVCDLGSFSILSKDLSKNLRDCQKVILFGATVGVEIDRFIAKYGRISPSKALLYQAIGAERIEALCDAFCEDIAIRTGAELSPRFSPGYGDLPLTAQISIFSLLDCHKKIGLSLNGSLMMSPSKSVTAFVGIKGEMA